MGSRAERPVGELLADCGGRAQRRAAISETDSGGWVAGEAPHVWAGLKLRAGDTRVQHVYSGSPAMRAGVSANDQIVALDGLRVSASNWSARLGPLHAGPVYPLPGFRNAELLKPEERRGGKKGGS